MEERFRSGSQRPAKLGHRRPEIMNHCPAWKPENRYGGEPTNSRKTIGQISPRGVWGKALNAHTSYITYRAQNRYS
jgi:hypothetical protein